MLRVELDHIVSENDAAQRILDILKDVEQNGETYAIMSNGQPVAAIVSIDQINSSALAEATAPPTPMDSPAPAPEPQEEPEPSLPEMPELPPMEPVTPDAPALPEMPASLPPFMPEQPMAMPPVVPEAPAMPVSSFMPPQDLGNSPLSEPLPEDLSGPLIAQAPVTQTSQPNLPPLSGTENLKQTFSVPNIPQQ